MKGIRWLIGMTFVMFTIGLSAQDADVSETQSTTSSSSQERVIRIPTSAKKAPPVKVRKPFKPSERIQFDSAVAFPTDI